VKVKGPRGIPSDDAQPSGGITAFNTVYGDCGTASITVLGGTLPEVDPVWRAEDLIRTLAFDRLMCLHERAF
jgi:hypothetical protein